MAATSAAPSAVPFQLDVELQQLVTWEHDNSSGKNNMVLNETMLAEIVAETENQFISMVILGPSTRRNTMLLSKLITCVNEHENAMQRYNFNESKYIHSRTGVWICSKPLKLHLKTSIVYVLLLEVQCKCSDFTADFELHNIFELGLLVSSVCILNFMETIDENILQLLGQSHEFVERTVMFPDKIYFQRMILFGGKRPDGQPQTSRIRMCKKFQSVVLLIGDVTSEYSEIIRKHVSSRKASVASILQANMATMAKSSKCSRELILQNFNNYELSLSVSPDLNARTVPDVSFLFESTKIQNYIKNLCGIPLQLKLFKELFVSMFGILRTDFLVTIMYEGYRLSMLQACTMNFNKFINDLVRCRFDQLRWDNENKMFWEGYFQNDRNELESQLRLSSNVFAQYLEKYASSVWSSSDIRYNRPQMGTCFRTKYRTDFKSMIVAILCKYETDFEMEKEKFLRCVTEEAKQFAQAEFERCVEKWDRSEFRQPEHITQIISDIKKNTLDDAKSRHPKILLDLTDTLNYIDNKKPQLLQLNQTVFNGISLQFKNSLMKVVGSMVDKLIDASNSMACDNLEEFHTLFAKQKQIHLEYFKRNEIGKFCQYVVAIELPKSEQVFADVFNSMTNKYLDKCVKNTYVNRCHVYNELELDLDLHEDTVTICFGTADVKHDVFPKLQIHIVQIMNDNKINTRILLELIELGIFDTMEMERPLHGRFELEQDRVLSLMKVIQNRNSDEIQMCLQKLCNLRCSQTKQKQFRDAFGSVLQDCIQRAHGTLD